MPFGTDTTDHYAVLGVEASASDLEIKKAYRKKARELHPDHNPDPAAAEEFKRVTHAHDVLSNPDKKTTYDRTFNFGASARQTDGPFGGHHWTFDDLYDHFAGGQSRGYSDWSRFTTTNISVPEPEEFVYQGVRIRVVYDTDGYRDEILVADLKIQIDDVLKLTDLPNPTHPVQKVRQVHLMDADEDLHVVWVEDSIKKLHECARLFMQQRELHKRVYRTGLRLECLTAKDAPIEAARQLFAEASQKVDRLYNSYSYIRVSYDSALAAVRALEKELDRLESTDPTELLVDGLMNGTLYPALAEYNREVLRQIEIFTIRSGGIWETELTDDDLRAFYRRCLDGATSLRNVWLIDLKLNLDDYVLEDDDLAPEKLVLTTRRGEREYDVRYSYSDVDGQKTPTGSIEVPQSVFEQFAAEYGKKHSFPDIGHGVKLWVCVLIAGDKVVSGWADDPKLIDRVDKRKKGLGRKADGNVEASTTPPPWAKGQSARSRRR